MPWTRRQVKKLLSSGSPLTAAQQNKMKAELHANPKLGHARKDSKAMKRTDTRAHPKSDTHAFVGGRRA